VQDSPGEEAIAQLVAKKGEVSGIGAGRHRRRLDLQPDDASPDFADDVDLSAAIPFPQMM
jgi:hypothetical protein